MSRAQQVIRSLHQSLFLRIYAGIVLACALIVILAAGLYDRINAQRQQNYRENIADGVMFLIGEGLARQTDQEARQNWLDDASLLLNLPVALVPPNSANLSRRELGLLRQGKAVVRFDELQGKGNLYAAIPNQSQLIHIQVDKLGEQQIKAVAVFLMDDLVQYPGREMQRLQTIRAHFDFPLALLPSNQVNLDFDQRARINRKEVILLYGDTTGASGQGGLTVISPSTGTTLLKIGPIPLFNPLPYSLVIGLALLSLLLIALATYLLIFPLEGRVLRLKQAMQQVRQGNFSARLPVEGHDEMAQLASMFNNMTSHIQRLIESQRDLTRAVSHELRTPVARIRFGVDMLADTDDPESRYAQQEMIDQDIQSLNNLIDEVLMYAKLEEMRPTLCHEDIDLDHLVRQVIAKGEKLATGKHVELNLPGQQHLVVSESHYLERAIFNLLSNALRHAEQRVRVSAEVRDGWAQVTIEDDGVGIEPQNRRKIFMPFTRLDDSRTRFNTDTSAGYGLGLSIVERIAQWFGGRVEVDDSAALGGALFRFVWPVQRNEQQDLVKEKKQKPPLAAP